MLILLAVAVKVAIVAVAFFVGAFIGAAKVKSELLKVVADIEADAKKDFDAAVAKIKKAAL